MIPTAFRHSALKARIGVARVDITPPVGIYARNWGAAMHDVATAVHRPLTLTALTIQPSTTDEADAGHRRPPLVLIDADLGWWKTPQAFEELRMDILSEAHIDAQHFVFALSHTHAGPPLMEPDLSLPGSELIGPWMRRIAQATRLAIESARATASDGLLEWHQGRCQLAAYRDLPDPDEHRSRIVCGYNPAGGGDDTLLVGRVVDQAGRLVATLVNYACHPTTLAWDNLALSPDFVGAMRDCMQRATGVPALFLQGASGELSPREQYVGDASVADRHGRQLAYAALSVLEDMNPAGHELAFDRIVESGAPLALWTQRPCTASKQLRVHSSSVELPIKDWPSAEELESQRAATKDRASEERLRRKRDIRRALGNGATYTLPIVIWRLGEAALVGSCCEAYSIFQSELRRRFRGRSIVCMNLVNGSMGYLPPAPLYDQDLYQVWQTPFDRGSLERTLEATSVALRSAFEDGSVTPSRCGRN